MQIMSTRLHGNNEKTLSLLGALCLYLSAIEYIIPKPLPFLRIGLANLPLMLALDMFALGPYCLLVLVKVIGQALITGTLFSYVFLFSLAGTFSSALLMFFLRRLFKRRISFIGIGTAGAVISNIAQLSLSRLFVFGESTRYFAPPFLITGLVTGIALGVFCETFANKSKWLNRMGNELLPELAALERGKTASSTENNSLLNISGSQSPSNKRCNIYNSLFSPNALFIAGLLIIPSLLFNPSVEYRVLQFLFFCFLAVLSGKKINFLFALLSVTAIVFFNMLVPFGRVLFSIGPLKITSGALRAGIERAVTIQALVILSKTAIRQDLKIRGFFGGFLSESMAVFSGLMNRKYNFKNKNPILVIDALLEQLSAQKIPSAQSGARRTSIKGFLLLASAVILSWLPWLLIAFQAE